MSRLVHVLKLSLNKALPDGTRANISELKDCMLAIAKSNVRGVGGPLRARCTVPYFVKLARTMPPSLSLH